MDWSFFLDNILIDEPVGFADISLRVKRDPDWHGIFFEASTSDMKFYGTGADYLRVKKRDEGFSAEVIFKAVVDCGGEDEIFEGKLDFRQYKESCGDTCFVIIPVEQSGCTMTMRNRYDQKVDLSSQVAFDKITVLPNYDGLNFGMDIEGQELPLRIAGTGQEDVQDSTLVAFPDNDMEEGQIWIRPTYSNEIENSIQTGQLIPGSNYGLQRTLGGLADVFGVMSPQLLMEEKEDCVQGETTYTFRLKGEYQIDHHCDRIVLQLRVGTWDGLTGISLITPGTTIDVVTIIDVDPASTPLTGEFDETLSGSVVLPEGMGLYAYAFVAFLEHDNVGSPDQAIIEFHSETSADIQVTRNCPATDAAVSLIHETASRVVEAITDRCLTVKSDYYGRVDSEPYAAAEDGCGSLRVLTNGLRLREAETSNHFLSLKEIFQSLRAIDNIGMEIEDETMLRIEPVEFFYQDVEILRHPAIPKADFALSPDDAYSIVKIGYKKWETENVSGLDEFNSNKEFRTSLKSINNTLDATSDFIAGGYAAEHTRTQSFIDTGAADTKYDNDTFIICVVRSPYAYGNYIVEQGNIANADNFFSPSTAYNWRIRPMYNLMRWWKSVAQSYVNLVNSASKLFFSAGTGNLLAEGELAVYDPCRTEAHVMAENSDLGRDDMITGEDPIFKPETMTYRYPMSLKDYNLVKANSKGYIYAECSGEFVKGFIENIIYRPAKGDADITLKLKWDIQS